MAFAVYTDVQTRLGRTLTVTEQAQVTALLDDVTAAIIDDVLDGNTVVQATTTATFQVALGERTIRLPQQPVQSVTSVLIGSAVVAGWAMRGGHLVLPVPVIPIQTGSILPVIIDSVPVTVTWVHGLAAVPASLKAWTCVLAIQALAAVSAKGGDQAMTAAAIDDARFTWDAAAAADAVLTIPERQRQRMASRWGAGAYVTQSTP